MKLTIKDIPVSMNGPRGLLRMHWARRRKYTEKWSWMIRGALGYPGVLEPAPDKARVYITQYRKRLMDTDNLFASVKPILDGLIDWQLIRDDSPGHCELTVKQEKSGETRTEISIEAS